MTQRRLIIQSHGSGDDPYRPWLELSRPVHEQYAARCGADYELFVGEKDVDLHPAWNRIAMMLEAFEEGYEKVVWLDADSLVVDLNVNIFTETRDDVALQMTCVLDSHVEFPWYDATGTAVLGWDMVNDGVLVSNNIAAARDAFSYVWSGRHEPPRPHHHPSLWELNLVADWVVEHPTDFAALDARFNWQEFRELLYLRDRAVIRSYHGMPHSQRWAKFRDAYARAYP